MVDIGGRSADRTLLHTFVLATVVSLLGFPLALVPTYLGGSDTVLWVLAGMLVICLVVWGLCGLGAGLGLFVVAVLGAFGGQQWNRAEELASGPLADGITVAEVAASSDATRFRFRAAEVRTELEHVFHPSRDSATRLCRGVRGPALRSAAGGRTEARDWRGWGFCGQRDAVAGRYGPPAIHVTLFSAPGVPPSGSLAAQLPGQALSQSGEMSSREGPVPSGSGGQGRLSS